MRWPAADEPFRTIDRQTGFLLPLSVDDRLPEKHLAGFVVEVIDGFDLRAMVGAYRGSGSAAHHPRMLLGVLVYGYATGVFSSRKLERKSMPTPAATARCLTSTPARSRRNCRPKSPI
jgi:hypothetical protein